MDGKQVEMTCFNPESLSGTVPELFTSPPGSVCRSDQKLYLMTGHTVLSCEDTAEGNAMMYAIASHQKQKYSCVRNASDLFSRMILDAFYTPDSSALKLFGINPDSSCRVAVFRSFLPQKSNFPDLFSLIAPVEHNDTIVPIDFQTAVLVRQMPCSSPEEFIEFTNAVIGTMEGEGYIGIKAGISSGISNVFLIQSAYQEAVNALYLGMKYHTGDQVFVYEQQMLDRIVEAIPPGKKDELINNFFRNGSANQLTDEVMETVSVFFRNDLNLTAASRELFVHRNTLNYRLDKIKKEFGLDLRSFRDAVVFQIVSEILHSLCHT